jgi:hypothetical protein
MPDAADARGLARASFSFGILPFPVSPSRLF